MKNPRVLFFHLGQSSFVKEDLRILRDFMDVREFYFDPRKTSPKPIYAFKLFARFVWQIVWLILHIRKTDLIYCWFSDFHGFLPALFSKLFRKPMLTVLGGSDCNKIKTLNYGVFSSSWRAPLGEFVIRNSTLLLPVHKTLIESDPYSKNWEYAHPNGLKNNLKQVNTSWLELPTGYSHQMWSSGLTARKPVVTTVGMVSDSRTALIKGWDYVLATAELLPDFEFQIVGLSKSFEPDFRAIYAIPNNVTLIPPMDREKLVDLYQHSSVYLQLSRVEGLPNVLCEAMICGCIPIGSAVFGIPSVIEQTGYVAEKPDPTLIAELVKKAHETASNNREKCRKYIVDNYSIEQRKSRLKDIIYNYLA